MPPVANPPSKQALLLLLKQARAFGLGVVLATQNPVDLDYKGLSNAGTWFLGRLQTERDKARLLDGLEGALTGQGATFDRGETERILSSLQKRTFFLHDVHEDASGDLPDALGDVVPARAADQGSNQAADAGRGEGCAAATAVAGRVECRCGDRHGHGVGRPLRVRSGAGGCVSVRLRLGCVRAAGAAAAGRAVLRAGQAGPDDTGLRADALRQGVRAVRRSEARRRRRA